MPAQAVNHAQAPAKAYAQRMNKVLDHIDQHLDRTLELVELAEVAHFSPYHFHRVFMAWMDETLGDYLRRRRLDVAALMLSHQSEVSVLDVALSVGFSSGEAFARAFKLRFGRTPSAWRHDTPRRWAQDLADVRQKATRSLQQDSNPDQADRTAHGNDGNTFDTAHKELPIVDITLQTLPPTRVAYMRHIGPYGPSVSRFWRETFLPWREAQGLGHAPCYGIGHDDPFLTPPDKCRCDTCVEVPPDFKAISPASIANLPGGRYAVARYRGDGTDIAQAWASLMRDWLPASGMQVDGRPFFERYEGSSVQDPATGLFDCTLCMPVKRL